MLRDQIPQDPAYDGWAGGRGELRALPFDTRLRADRGLDGAAARPRFDLSPMVPFAEWTELARLARGDDARGYEGMT